jgi:hypothetical protein
VGISGQKMVCGDFEEYYHYWRDVTHFVHDSSLLLQRHSNGILVAIAVQANLVAGVGDHAALFRESLERVARDEPGGFDVVLFKHLEKAADTDRSGEEAWDYLSVDSSLENWASCLEVAVSRFLLSSWHYVPREMSLVLSSPPYEPSQPATASMSTEIQHWTSGLEVSFMERMNSLVYRYSLAN